MSRNEVYKTTNVLILASLVAFLLTGYFSLLFFGIGLLISNLLYFRLSRIVSEAWMKLAHFIGNINSKIILTLVFFFVLTPIGVLFRMFNSLKARHFKSGGKKSYFERVRLGYKKDYFIKQW